MRPRMRGATEKIKKSAMPVAIPIKLNWVEKKAGETFLCQSPNRTVLGSTGKLEKKAFRPGLTIASVKEKEINPMTMDARLIEARAMAFGGTSAHRSQTWGSGGGAVLRMKVNNNLRLLEKCGAAGMSTAEQYFQGSRRNDVWLGSNKAEP